MLFALCLSIPIGALYGLKDGEIYGLEASILIGIAVVAGILMFAGLGNIGNVALPFLAMTRTAG